MHVLCRHAVYLLFADIKQPNHSFFSHIIHCRHAMRLQYLTGSGAESQVRLILALISNVTGIKLNAFFAAVSGDGASAQARQGFPWQRADGFGHAVRRLIIRCAEGRFACMCSFALLICSPLLC